MVGRLHNPFKKIFFVIIVVLFSAQISSIHIFNKQRPPEYKINIYNDTIIQK